MARPTNGSGGKPSASAQQERSEGAIVLAFPPSKRIRELRAHAQHLADFCTALAKDPRRMLVAPALDETELLDLIHELRECLASLSLPPGAD